MKPYNFVQIVCIWILESITVVKLFVFERNTWNHKTAFKLVWFPLILWHINRCRVFNAKKTKTTLYIYIKYIWFDLVCFYGISIAGKKIMPNPFYTYISNIGFGFVLWHNNNWRIFNTKSSLYKHIKYIWFCLVCFGLVWFYGISTIIGYIIPNPFYTYILDIWFGLIWFMAYQQLSRFNAKSFLYVYIIFFFVGFYNIVILFTNPSARAGYNTRSIFKGSLTCLNSEFFILLD